MGSEGQSQNHHYKIKLVSGRVLGPIDLDRVKLLILKNQVTGAETARRHPDGEWLGINQIPEIAELLVAKITGALKKEDVPASVNPFGATTLLEGDLLPGAAPLDLGVLGTIPLALEEELPPAPPAPPPPDPSPTQQEDVGEKTQMGTSLTATSTQEEDRTRVASEEDLKGEAQQAEQEPAVDLAGEPVRNLSHESTVIFQRSTESVKLPGKRKKSVKDYAKEIAVGVALAGLAYVFLVQTEPPSSAVVRREAIRPKLPTFEQGRADPSESMRLYGEGVKLYLQDTVEGYENAAEKFRKAASRDNTNVKALAMLASSYINLIDSSNKDENYFVVLSKLIDLSRAKQLDLPETVIADVEFYLVVNKADAALSRLEEYTLVHQPFGIELFYYLALAKYAKDDAVAAAQAINNFPESKAFSAKVFFLRGLIAEKLNDFESAMLEYQKALKFNARHAKSRLRVATLLSRKGQLKEAANHIDFLITNSGLLAPRDLGLAYYLHAQLSELYQKWDIALGDIERASKLDPDNHDYLLEMYTLQARSGGSLETAQKQARMYYFLGEGERLIGQGRYQEALSPLLQARQANDSSPLPLLKIGDMFAELYDVENAKKNYKMAAERAPNNILVWSKYIRTLIQSYEWEEATKAMDRFRKLPVAQSSIDKAAADLYQKQGKYAEAQTFYRKAMARESIDSDVYSAYAKSLMATKNFKDAPFFFALSLRFDPLNISTLIDIAKCVAETESIDRAISSLQDQLSRRANARAEFLAAIAELYMQKGAWGEAQNYVDQAIKANPVYAYSWKLQAQIYMNSENTDKTALTKALSAYKSYSERNPSDPIGYLERYKIFVKKAEFENGKDELNRIYEIYPKYPNLHYYMGALYSVQGNHKVAAEEHKKELQNNPDSPQTLLAYGKELLELERPQEALAQFTKVMQINPASAEAKQNAGWANYYLRNFQAALSLIRSAIAIDKGNPILFRRLGTVYRDMGDAQSACVAFRNYLAMEPDAPDKGDFQNCL
ncbi:MAG: tetratricopeptide repeat protein [Bdellovibrio sp.]|nr:tetratricopeptide repeat protein [Bdellovibrio sp.]